MRRSTLPAALIALTLTLSACGDDDTTSTATTAAATPAPETTPATTPETTLPETTTPETTGADPAPETTTGASPDTTSPAEPADGDAEFSAIAEEINSSNEAPTLEQMERYVVVASPELQPAVETVIEVVTAADGDFSAVLESPDALAAIDEISAVEAELCGISDEPDQDASVMEIDPNATRVDVIATDYAYEATLPTEPGRYSFVMQNEGEEPHIMVLIRLEDGVALDDVLAAEGDEGVAEDFQSSPATPGEEGVLTADLGPGNWVLLCPIPGPEGHPHFVDGMINEFTVG